MGFSLKSLLPVVGAAAGLAIPGGGAITAALGSGIGTLVAGGDPKDAIKNALLAGGTAKVFPGMGEGIQGLVGTAPQAAATAGAEQALTSKIAEEAASKSFMESLMSPKGLLVGGGLAALLGGAESDSAEMSPLQRRMLETGERLPDYQGQSNVPVYIDYITGEYTNDPEVERRSLEEVRRREASRMNMAQGGIVSAYNLGGFVEGPGTGTSDDIKAQIYQNGVPVQEARLSDEEFVFTKKAVKGAGNGDTGKGAAKMYAMMQNFERMA